MVRSPDSGCPIFTVLRQLRRSLEHNGLICSVNYGGEQRYHSTYYWIVRDRLFRNVIVEVTVLSEHVVLRMRWNLTIHNQSHGVVP